MGAWENEKQSVGKRAHIGRVSSILFRVLPNYHKCFYNILKHTKKCFQFLLKFNSGNTIHSHFLSTNFIEISIISMINLLPPH